MDQVSLFSSIEIERSDLENFFLQVGAQYMEAPYLLSNYVLHAENATVWIDLDNIEPHYPDPEVDALREQKLGGPPRTDILLHVISGLESEQLALDFACQIAAHWPFVLDNNNGLARRIYSLEELQNLRKEHLSFWEEAKHVSRPEEPDPFDKAVFIPPGLIEEYRSQGLPLPDWIKEQMKLQDIPETETEENDEDYLSEVHNLLDQGLVMDAIKLYRRHTRVELSEAARIVQAMKKV